MAFSTAFITECIHIFNVFLITECIHIFSVFLIENAADSNRQH